MHNMKITSKDFEQLTINSTNWYAYREDWKLQEGRFEDIDFEITEPIDWTYERAYWVERYADVLFVRAFLEGIGRDSRVYYDTADDTYMITTDFGGAL